MTLALTKEQDELLATLAASITSAAISAGGVGADIQAHALIFAVAHHGLWREVCGPDAVPPGDFLDYRVAELGLTMRCYEALREASERESIQIESLTALIRPYWQEGDLTFRQAARRYLADHPDDGPLFEEVLG